jgi:hypothetical protein
MKTDDLIDLLGTNIEPVRGEQVRNTLLVALAVGVAVAMCLVLLIFGAPGEAFGGEYLGEKVLIGQKPPLRLKHVWAIRTRLQMEGQVRDLALFNLAIDSKLRGCDVVALRVEDVAPSGYAVERATVRQKKTGRSVRFELTEQTRQAVDDHIKAAQRKPGEFLFCSRRNHGRCMTTRQYARLLAS